MLSTVDHRRTVVVGFDRFPEKLPWLTQWWSSHTSPMNAHVFLSHGASGSLNQHLCTSLLMVSQSYRSYPPSCSDRQ
jgi:hypothetical protein